MRKAPAFANVKKSSAEGPRPSDGTEKVERDIQRLAAAVQKFQIDTQRFFAGDLPVPPDELRERIQADLRRLRGANLRGAAANFRLGSLEARFNSHVELFGRRLRGREQAHRRRPAAEQKAPDAVQGVVIGRRADPESARALYHGLHSASGKPKMDLDRFCAYLDRQSEAIRKQTGCAEIQFRIAVEGGKMKLKAKPIRRG
ncbi:MAG: MXAN_5187 C-terminal domain-containing protein [Thermoanaerobaculia bacterium]